VAERKLELRELGDGGSGVQILYQPEGTEGSRSANTLTVGSYPLPDPEVALEVVAGRPGSVTRQADDGREAVTNQQSATSVYLADPDNRVQIEVYDPSPARAMRLALSGRVKPAG